MSTDALGFILALLAVGMSMTAVRSRHLLVTLGASALWASLMAYFLGNASAGANWLVIFVLSAMAFMIAMLILGVFSRHMTTREDYESGSTFSRFAKKLDFDDKYYEKSHSSNSEDEYKLQVRRALRRGRRKR